MLIFDPQTGDLVSREPVVLCSFGITEAIAGALTAVFGISEATAAAVAPAILGAGSGAAVGGGIDAVTGKPVLPGILEGGITGAAIGGLGPAVGGALGIGTTAGDVLVGAGAGALGGAVTGQSPLAGAEGGGIGGLASGLAAGAIGGTGGGATPNAGTGTGGSAAGTAAPAGASPGGGSFLSNIFGGGGGGPVGGLPSSPITPGAPSDAAVPGTYGATSDFATNVSGATPTATGGSGSFLSNLFGGGGGGSTAGDSGGGGGIGSFAKNYGAPLVAAGGIGLDLLRGTTPLPNQSALSAEAGQLSSEGSQLQSYLSSGTLPPGVQNSLTSAADQAKAAIRSRYAQMGGDTSAMQQDLANVDQVTATQGAQIATQLLSEGVSETGLSEQIYGQLLNLTLQQNTALSGSVGSLATALAGGGRPVILQQQGSNA